MHEQEGTIRLSAAAKFTKMDILLQQMAESYLLAHASLSKFLQAQQIGFVTLGPLRHA